VDTRWGWLLAAAALGVGWWSYGWRGVVLALTVTAFWMLLQLSRTLRLMRQAAEAPLGHVASAVMFHARLRAGLSLADVIRSAGSLGRKVKDDPQTFAWADPGDACVEVEFVSGRCSSWRLRRPQDAASGA
jgi:hypothetical protein